MTDIQNTCRDEEHYRDELRKLKGPLLEHISELAEICDAPRPEVDAHAGTTGTMLAQLQIASFRLGRESMQHAAAPAPGPTNEDDGSAILTIELSRAQVERLLEGSTFEGDITRAVGSATIGAMSDLVDDGDPMVYRVRMVEDGP